MEKKSLYKATNVRDLNKLVPIANKSNSTQAIMKAMNECFKKADGCRLVDEEVAYILFMRYFDCYEHLKKLSGATRVTAILSTVMKKQTLLAMDYLEELHSSLTRRYAELQNLENVPTSETRHSSPPSSASSTVHSKVSPTNAGPGWLSVSDLVVKLRKHSNVLIIDTRRVEDCEYCRIKCERFINLPTQGDLFKAGGITFSTLSRLLDQGASKAVWAARGDVDDIVLVDYSIFGDDPSKFDLPVDSVLPNDNPLRILIELISKCDAQNTVTKEPVILAGGMQEFLLRYAPLTTNPDYRMRREPNSTTDARPRCVNEVDYPDLFTAERKKSTEISALDTEEDKPPLPSPAFGSQEVTESSPPTIFHADSSRPHSDSSSTNRTAPTSSKQSLEIDLEDRLRHLRMVKPSHQSISSNAVATCNGQPHSTRKMPTVDRSRKPKVSPTSATSNTDRQSPDELKFAGARDRCVSVPTSDKSTPVVTVTTTPSDSSLVSPPPSSATPRIPPRNLKHSDSPADYTSVAAKQITTESWENMLPPKQPTGLPTTLPSSSSMPTIHNIADASCPSPTLPSCNFRPVGLPNLGNSCYMNAAIQPLVHTRALASFFLRQLHDVFTTSANPLGYGGAVSRQFQRLFTALWSSADCSQEIRIMKSVVGKHQPAFAGNDQQDSLEFLTFLLDGLHEDMNVARKRFKITDISESSSRAEDENCSLKERATAAWECYLQANESVIVSSFQGQLLSSVQCSCCTKTSWKFDSFMYLSLPIPPDRSSCNLEDCMTLFGQPEWMTGSCRWLCPRCNKPTDATKRIDLWRLPTYLIIHLKRFQYCNQSWQKSTSFVEFPIYKLDPKTFTTEPQTDRNSYALYAVLNHSGTMESGHYTACCRGISDALWYEYDDSCVSQISESRIQTSAAYLLFYERLPRLEVFSK